MTESIWQQLAAPFAPDEIEWRETGGQDAPYPRPDAIMNRLDAVVGPEGWDYTLQVITADPRPVYICTLRVRDVTASVQPQPWVTRSATSGEPIMGRRDGPDFLNAGKAGGTYAFRKAFQDGFCRYLSDPRQWPSRGGQAPARAAAAPAPSAVGDLLPTDFKGFQPANPDNPPCPICKGQMWDNRKDNTSGTRPNFKCKNAPKTRGGPGCAGVWWPLNPRRAPAGRPNPPAAPPIDTPVNEGWPDEVAY